MAKRRWLRVRTADFSSGKSLVQKAELIDAAACTMAGVVYTEDPELKPVGDQLMLNLAKAWIRSKNADNDVWADASGNSIRNLIDILAIGESSGPMDELRPIISALLSDDVVQRNTKQVLVQATAAGHMVHLPAQLQYLADVNASGIPLSSGTAWRCSAWLGAPQSAVATRICCGT